MNGNPHRAERLGRVTVAILFALSLVLTQPLGISAEEKLGEEAIGAALDSLSPDPEPEPTEEPPAESNEAPPAENNEAPPADEPAAEPASDEPAPSGDDTPPADDTSSSNGGSDEPAAPVESEVAAFENPAPADDTASNAAPAADESISLEQSAINNVIDSGGDSGRRSSGDDKPKSLTQSATRNVLSGNSALGGALPVNGGSGVDSANQPREVTALRSAGDNLVPSTISPRRNNGERRSNRNDPEDNGTVVVNSLSDAGDQGKLAVHGRFVAGTLCDGSQFWSLNGGGTVNANGITLSANGGTAGSSASGGDDNIAGGNGSAGNGGRANASADGGIVVVQELITGNNRGNEVTVGDQTFTGDCGQGVINGGDATTINNVNISADGGTALASADGGDNNIAGRGGNAGNGGRASASADGGIVIVGSLDLGGNQGNTINATGGPGAGGCLIDGGSVRNINNIDISADGGTAIANANGGDDNVAFGEDANAGNGGRARANADGGLVLVGDITTGNNSGNTINADCGGGGGAGGRVVINGGSVLNETNIKLNADGGTAIADASGGDGNIVFGLGPNDEANAGNGGRARSDASGGRIEVGNIVTGNNTGNVIAVGSSFVQGRTPDSNKPGKPEKLEGPR